MNHAPAGGARADVSHDVEILRHVWIPMRDDVRLAARVWLPADARERPVPAIFEYIPYRKNDATATRDAEQPGRRESRR